MCLYLVVLPNVARSDEMLPDVMAGYALQMYSSMYDSCVLELYEQIRNFNLRSEMNNGVIVPCILLKLG